MIYSHEVQTMCPVAQGVNHGPAPIPEEAKWVKAKEVKDISGLTHGVGSVSYTHLDVYKRQLFTPNHHHMRTRRAFALQSRTLC